MPPIRPLVDLPRKVRPSRLTLRGPQDALGVILAAAPVAEPATVVLLLDHDHAGLGAVTVAGTGTEQADEDVLEWVLHLAASEPGLGAAVLASVHHGQGYRADPGETCWFLGCRDRFRDAGVELVDWFLVDDGHAGSRAEQLGAEALWRGGRAR